MTFELSATSISREDAEAFLAVHKIATRYISLEEVITHQPWLTMLEAKEVLDRWAVAGLVDWNDRGKFYELAPRGDSLVASGLVIRIDREAAEAAPGKAIEKARKWNTVKSHPVAITELRLFGSLLEDKPDYGDVDIEVICAPREISPERMKDLVEAIPASARRSIFCQVNPERFALDRSAKQAAMSVNRVPDVSATAEGTIERLGADWRQVYAYELAAEAEVPADDTHHPRTKPREDPADEHVSKTSPDFLLPEIEPSSVIENDLWAVGLAKSAERVWWGDTKNDGTRHPILPKGEKACARALYVDAIPALEIEESDPFEAIRAICKHGQEQAGVLPGDIEVTVTHEGVWLYMPIDNLPGDHEGAFREMVFEVKLSGMKRDLLLVPRVRIVGPPEMGDVPEAFCTEPVHVAMARSLARPMIELAERLRLAQGVDVDLFLFWNPEALAPDWPDIGPLTRYIMRAGRSFSIPRDLAREVRARWAESADDALTVSIRQGIEFEIRGMDQVLPEGDKPITEESVGVEATARLSTPWLDGKEAVDFTPAVSETDHVAAARKALPALRGMGGNWVLSLSRSTSKTFHLEHDGRTVPDEDRVIKMLEAEKVGVR